MNVLKNYLYANLHNSNEFQFYKQIVVVFVDILTASKVIIANVFGIHRLAVDLYRIFIPLSYAFPAVRVQIGMLMCFFRLLRFRKWLDKLIGQ